jgi:hypothetical protein
MKFDKPATENPIDRLNVVGGHADTLGVVADCLGAGRLVDADGPECPVLFCDHIAADPADVLWELVGRNAL